MGKGSTTHGAFFVAGVDGLDEIIEALDPKIASTTAMRTLNKVGAQAMTAGKRSITSNYTIKYSNLETSSVKASIKDLVFLIRAVGRRRQMSKSKYYRSKQTSSGVVSQIQRGKGEFTPHAFIGSHTRGGSNVYLRSMTKKSKQKRIGKNGKAYYYMLPTIVAQLGPSVANLFNIKSTQQAIRTSVFENFGRLFRSQLSYELSRVLRKNVKSGKGS